MYFIFNHMLIFLLYFVSKTFAVFSDRVIPEKAAAKKKKQKSKVQKNDENMDILFSLNGEEEDTRTLSNGLVIKYLESSKSDGKAAALGRKVSSFKSFFFVFFCF